MPKFSLKQDARNCVIRHRLMRVVVGLDYVSEKNFDGLVRQFKRKRLFGVVDVK